MTIDAGHDVDDQPTKELADVLNGIVVTVVYAESGFLSR